MTMTYILQSSDFHFYITRSIKFSCKTARPPDMYDPAFCGHFVLIIYLQVPTYKATTQMYVSITMEIEIPRK